MRRALGVAAMKIQPCKLPPLLSLALVAAACASPIDVEDVPTGEVGSELGLTLPLKPLNPPVVAQPEPTLADVCAQYSGHDKDGDGSPELTSLALAPFDDANVWGAAGVLVLVDPSLLQGAGADALVSRLITWRSDLSAEGFAARFVVAGVKKTPSPTSANKQDGLTLLAMRDFVKAAKPKIPSLAGVVLVGSFPEATLVLRTVKAYKPAETWSFDGRTYVNVNVLRGSVDRINPRGDIVLGDLDGNWEGVYRRAPRRMPRWTMRMPNVTGPWPNAGSAYVSTVFEYAEEEWSDFFDVDDDMTYVPPPTTNASGQRELTVYVGGTVSQDLEASSADRLLANPIARPELFVSRINARGVALQPSLPPDLDGKLPLDAAGRPQELRFRGEHTPETVPFAHDPAFEKQLLVEYFDRNHAFRRVPSLRPPYRTSAAASTDPLADGLPSAASVNSTLMTAGSGWQPAVGGRFDLAGYATWLRQPAVLRGISAHSTSTFSVFPRPADPQALLTAIGGPPLAWSSTTEADGTKVLRPDVAAITRADWVLSRTLHAHRVLPAGVGSIYVHLGCDVTNPVGTGREAYDAPEYGRNNNGESVLFFLNGVALMGRSKVFNDAPTAFLAALAPASATLGRGWRAGFDADAADAVLRQKPYDRKRAYYWSLLGDWTLRVKYGS